jgi:hypothetical protein
MIDRHTLAPWHMISWYFNWWLWPTFVSFSTPTFAYCVRCVLCRFRSADTETYLQLYNHRIQSRNFRLFFSVFFFFLLSIRALISIDSKTTIFIAMDNNGFLYGHFEYRSIFIFLTICIYYVCSTYCVQYSFDSISGRHLPTKFSVDGMSSSSSSSREFRTRV